ncbi:Protein SOSEKI 1 [Extremus antarcticus]|uniref:Protein SOSEKI 1 n=1 Tax=Extremus antarcticus TaxID=702011 RepID=A0AAJ0DHR0_9PEZI|nr:Protein SOSEKI 1 [Extremus antarcticus]
MYPPSNNHNVGVDEHAPPSSSSFQSSTASGGNESPIADRSRPLKPVTSTIGSQEGGSPDQESPAISESSTCSDFPLPQQQSSSSWTKTTFEQSMSDPCYLIVEFMDEAGVELAECFRSATEQPPITPESLAELDMPRIINNPKLRHDCNFDRELHFRPNLDGPKGKQKIKSAEDYWKALEGELFIYGMVHQQRRDPSQSANEESWRGVLYASQKRLPQVFHTIRDILKTLVPDSDQKAILERLDVDLIMQEILNGVCDLIDLGSWLAKILKNHCAPMRDSMVDAMQLEIKRGASEEKPDKLVNGIRQLLNILEAMKLDVANHQIRHMRPLLVEDTVNFLRKYNAHRISLGKIDASRSYLWMEDERMFTDPALKVPSALEAVTSALLKSLVFYELAPTYPQTFYLDQDRLRGLRVDLHSSIYHLVCRDVLIAMAGPLIPRHDLQQAVAALHITISAIERLSNIAAEIMRIVLLLEGRGPPFDATLLDFIEQHLENDMHHGSSAFQKHGQDLLDRLIPKLQDSVHDNIKVSALRLQDILLPPAPLPAQPQPFGFGAVLAPVPATIQSDPDDDLIRRFTHVIVLHWQVWANLVYTGTPTPQDPDEEPKVPVAHAIYAPGAKWLPSSVGVVEMPASGLPTPAASPDPEASSPGPQARPIRPQANLTRSRASSSSTEASSTRPQSSSSRPQSSSSRPQAHSTGPQVHLTGLQIHSTGPQAAPSAHQTSSSDRQPSSPTLDHHSEHNHPNGKKQQPAA